VCIGAVAGVVSVDGCRCECRWVVCDLVRGWCIRLVVSGSVDGRVMDGFVCLCGCTVMGSERAGVWVCPQASHHASRSGGW